MNNLNGGIMNKIVVYNDKFTEQLEIAKSFNKYLNEVAISLENLFPNNDINPPNLFIGIKIRFI